MPSADEKSSDTGVPKSWKSVALLAIGLAGGGGGSTMIFGKDVAANENRITIIEQQLQQTKKAVEAQTEANKTIVDLHTRIVGIEKDIGYLRREWEGCGPIRFDPTKASIKKENP